MAQQVNTNEVVNELTNVYASQLAEANITIATLRVQLKAALENQKEND